MSAIKTGGPAFPSVIGPPSEFAEGMTLRDWFAGHAMQAALATSKADNEASLLNMFLVVAKYSYLVADAMIAARELRS